MQVVDEGVTASRRRMQNLQFEDFLEAIVRLCGMKAMPLDADIQQGGYADAGDLIVSLRSAADFDENSPTCWNGFRPADDPSARAQPVARKVSQAPPTPHHLPCT